MEPKDCGGLVIVGNGTANSSDQSHTRIANVASRGVDHIALKVPWNSIEPSSGVYDWSYIDDWLVRYPDHRFTLRIQAGNSSPAWLKTATGGGIDVYNVARSQWANVHRWWTDEGMQAWDYMIHALGARYDANPRIVMVSACSQTVVFSEPYILGSHQESGALLYEAGLNLSTTKASITRCVDDTIDAFPNTLVELAIHSSLQYPISGGMAFSWPQGRNLAADLSAKHGKHLVCSDYGLKTGHTLASYGPESGRGTDIYNATHVYTFMHFRTLPSAGVAQGPITFQLTVGQDPNPNLYEVYSQAVQNAIDFGAWQCETAGWANLNDPPAPYTFDTTYYDLALKANAAEGFPTDTPASQDPPVVIRGDAAYIRNDGAWEPRTMVRIQK